MVAGCSDTAVRLAMIHSYPNFSPRPYGWGFYFIFLFSIMNSNQPSHSPAPENAAAAALHRIRTGTSPFAIIKHRHQPEYATIYEGDMVACELLGDIPRPEKIDSPHDDTVNTLTAIPYAQLREKGMDIQDTTPIRCMRVQSQTRVTLQELLQLLPTEEIVLAKPFTYHPDSRRFVQHVEGVQRDAIGKGLGSSFTPSRQAVGQIADYNRDKLLSMLGCVLRNEFGSYMSFAFDNGESALLGASPERHLSVENGVVTMTPISGTLRKLPEGTTRDHLISFLRNAKEMNELFMVLDEELKLMAQMCERGGEVHGPYLLEMSKVIHTGYELVGRSDLDVMELYRRSMLAPTVTGSPMSSAPDVIAQHEDRPRRYYSGTLNLLGRNSKGNEVLDSAIAIRMAEITPDGTITLQAGATIVRDSDPHEEAKETEGKLAGMLHAIFRPGSGSQKILPSLLDEEIRHILAERNVYISDYFFRNQEHVDRRVEELTGKNITVIDNEDDFCHMLENMMTRMGAIVNVVPYKDFDPETDASDIVVIGPGPGDPTKKEDEKMQKIARVTDHLLRHDRKFIAVCLGHQILCKSLCLPLTCKEQPMQGVQKEIDFFGQQQRVGFYNTFAARSMPLDSIEQSVDPDTHDVYALKGKRFASFQFHPESILSQNGFEILRESLVNIIQS